MGVALVEMGPKRVKQVAKWVAALAGAAGFLACLQAVALAAVPIGTTQVVIKKVTGEVEEQLRLLDIRDDVHQDEIISTAPDSATEIVFRDGTKISIGPDTRLTLDRFVYDAGADTGTFEMKVIEGVVRFVSGKLADPSETAYKIKTPTVTIGIRGTTLTAVVDADGNTATLLSTPSRVTVASRTGQVVELDSVDSATTSLPDGTLSEPGPLPSWAMARINELDTLISAATSAEPDPGGRPSASQAAAGDPPAPDTPAPDPPAADPPSQNPGPGPGSNQGTGRALDRAASVASTTGLDHGIDGADDRADNSAEGAAEHGRGAGPAGAGGDGDADGDTASASVGNGDRAGGRGDGQGGNGAARGGGSDAGGGKGGGQSGGQGSASSADGGAAAGGTGEGQDGGPGSGKGGGPGGGKGGGPGSGKGGGPGAGNGGGPGAGNGGGPGGGGGGGGGPDR